MRLRAARAAPAGAACGVGPVRNYGTINNLYLCYKASMQMMQNPPKKLLPTEMCLTLYTLVCAPKKLTLLKSMAYDLFL